MHAAPTQHHITWTYAELAAVLADVRKLQNIRHGYGVLIVDENSAPLLAIAESDAWSVAVKPRFSAPEVDRLGDHSAVRRVFLDEIPDTANRYADIFVVSGPRMRDVGTAIARQCRSGLQWIYRRRPRRHRRLSWTRETPPSR